jgi:hypothetical protein
LVQEVRAMEILANEIEVAPDRLQDYWATSAELITLVADIEEFAATHPSTRADDPAMVALRRRVREIAARLEEMALE